MVTLRTFQPNAEKVFFVTEQQQIEMEREHTDGIFTITIPTSDLPDPPMITSGTGSSPARG
jgi:hypothetical protein